MEKQALTAEVRKAGGKGPARQLRAGGKVPAVLYGPGGEAQSISVDPTQLTKALKTQYRRNQLIELDIAGNKQLALVKDLDVHPISRAIRHADFYRVALDRPATFQVALHTKGKAKGVGKGGELRQHFRELPLRCTPDKVPFEVVVNVENLDMLESIRVKDLQLGADIEVLLPAERAIVLCTAEVKKIAEEGEGAPAAAGGAAAAPAAAAPAKAPAKK